MTKYAAASYASTCPTPPNGASIVRYFNDRTTDTQATLFRDDARKELVIAFRGVSNVAAFLTDDNLGIVPLNAPGTDCSDCGVHNGTLLAW